MSSSYHLLSKSFSNSSSPIGPIGGNFLTINYFISSEDVYKRQAHAHAEQTRAELPTVIGALHGRIAAVAGAALLITRFAAL